MSSTTKPTPTWSDLLEFALDLKVSQLGKPVTIQGPGFNYYLGNLETIKEDLYDSGTGDLITMKELLDNTDPEVRNLDDYPLIYKAGTPYLRIATQTRDEEEV